MKQEALEARTTMNNEQLLQQIVTELSEIRKLLSASQVPAVSNPVPKSGFVSDEEIPQPTEIIESPEEVAVHFGKNNGIPLGSLGERSIAWYAKELEPKLDRNGKPFPPRAADVRLRNAARIIIHRRRGTLKTTGITRVDVAPVSLDEGEVNF